MRQRKDAFGVSLPVQIRFFPDGSATGGRVRLARDNRQYVVVVDWLTGSVSLEE